jgi:hypothetical protein
MRVEVEVGQHVLVDLLLQVDADGAVDADDLVGAGADAGRDVAPGIGDAAITAVVADLVLRALDRGGHQPGDEVLARGGRRRLGGERPQQDEAGSGQRQMLHGQHHSSL